MRKKNADKSRMLKVPRWREHIYKLEGLIPAALNSETDSRIHMVSEQMLSWFFDEISVSQMCDLWSRATDLERLHIATAWGYLERYRRNCLPYGSLFEYLSSCGVTRLLGQKAIALQIAFLPSSSSITDPKIRGMYMAIHDPSNVEESGESHSTNIRICSRCGRLLILEGCDRVCLSCGFRDVGVRT